MNIFNLYINSSIHVAIALVAFYSVTLIELNLVFCWDTLFFLFFATIIGYNFVKYSDVVKFKLKTATNNLKFIIVFTILSCFLIAYFITKLNYSQWLIIFVLAVLNMFYVVPVFKKKKNLRSISLLKVFIIALIWTLATVFISLKEINKITHVESYFWWYSLQRFLMIFSLMIPFEIRDVSTDKSSIRTLPQVLGIKKTKLIGCVLLFMCIIINYFIMSTFHLIIHTSIALLLSFFIIGSSVSQSKYFASFWVESIPVVYLFVHIIF